MKKKEKKGAIPDEMDTDSLLFDSDDNEPWLDDSENTDALDVEGDMMSLYDFGFGDNWEDLPAYSHEMVRRRARTLDRRPREKGIRLRIPDDSREEKLDELERAASLEKAGGRGARPRERRRGGKKQSHRAASVESQPNRQDERPFLLPRLGPRR